MFHTQRLFFMVKPIYQIFLKSSGISTDSRSVEPGQLFFALSGEHFNGNKYAKQALERGAIGVVIDHNPDDLIGENIFLVDNVLRFLQAVATRHRNTFDIPVIAITGSNGKTTTKELLANCLCQKYDTLFTQGNFNNHIGVPLTLLKLTDKHEIAIIEMGANHVEEIALLANIANPTHGFITNVGNAHLEGFGGIDGVLKGKLELYDYLNKNSGVVFFNPFDHRILGKIYAYKKTISIDPYVVYEQDAHNETITITYGDKAIHTNLVGEYNLLNIKAVIGIAAYFGVENSLIIKGLESYQPTNNRSQLSIWRNIHVIFDAYNANPSSVEQSILSFSKIKAQSKNILIGDMFELGNFAKKFHLDIIQLAVKQGFNKCIFVGNHFVEASKGQSFDSTIVICDSTERVKPILMELKEESHLLVKASRGMKLEKLFE